MAREYPRELFGASALVCAASIAEGFSIAALLPTLTLAASGQPKDMTGLNRHVFDLFEAVGLNFTLANLTVLVLIGIGLKGLFTWLAKRQAAYAVIYVITHLRLALMDKLFRARWTWITSLDSGVLANAVGQESRSAGIAFNAVVNSLAGISQCVVYLMVGLMVSWEAMLLTLIGGVIIVVSLSWIVRRSRALGQQETKQRRDFFSTLMATVHGMKPIRAMGREAHHGKLLHDKAQSLRQTLKHQSSDRHLLPSLREPIIATVIAGAFLMVHTQGTHEFSTLAVIGFLMWRSSRYINAVQSSYQTLVSREPLFWSLKRILDDSDAHREPRTGRASVPEWRRQITFKDVAFAYRPDTPIFSSLSMRLPAEALTVMTGPSGIGKSTAIDLLAGFLTPSKGTIHIDDTPLAEIDVQKWRAQIGYVPQDMILMHDTVFNNVALGDPELDGDKVKKALDASGALDFVAALPEGIDTIVGERGQKLSGGQRQRIALARALVREPRLLILDEVTASLDPATERGVIDTLLSLSDRATILAVTHQQALIDAADTVIDLSDRGAEVVKSSGDRP